MAITTISSSEKNLSFVFKIIHDIPVLKNQIVLYIKPTWIFFVPHVANLHRTIGACNLAFCVTSTIQLFRYY